MRLRILAYVAACLASIVGTTILHGSLNDADAVKVALEKELQGLLKQRLISAQRVREAVQAAFEAETVTFDQLVDAYNQLMEAEIALAANRQDEIAALERHVERTKQIETRLKLLFDAGAKGGEAKEYFTAKRERQSAEVLLLKAKIKALH